MPTDGPPAVESPAVEPCAVEPGERGSAAREPAHLRIRKAVA
jgi:hypothetical protein